MVKYTKDYVTKHFKGIIVIIMFLIFISLLEDVLENEIMSIDVYMYRFAVDFLRSDWLTPIMEFFTFVGSAYVIIGICVLSLLFIKDKKIGLIICGNAAMITIINQLMKRIVQRPRPSGSYLLVNESGYSFPSGHSMVSMAFYSLLIYLIYRSNLNKKIKITLSVILVITIIMIGLSRIYLGAHYASDVIAGFSISLVYLYIIIKHIIQLD